ncbi:EAL domain, c-di-GMP-specific phosphodiesterase class I (or its enzymatically inactive variant) [Butyrivibrio proteoclasticus]|uniref:EAL domain, c-di-GMP-specific phosphodiesterase class I (Or its enzymatically inactive variant) n=1 Tax=Butyrivibrio proteoclasticus TaxID=43305 RepID=A0A1I5UB11_9FIRM|nr:EAL domain-containing protein [Butyrivibrio proteoclasticus]SFP92481.1 EAL domain, c-di-GMP-specific phosphodiesterase class I (or its enzymatically inactive variant) [Butyrivibrio proteoclasticus]
MIEMNLLGAASFRIAAAIISITCIFYTTVLKTKKSIRRRLFLILIYIVFTDSIVGLICAGVAEIPDIPYKVKYDICFFLNSFYYFIHFGTVVIFLYYMSFVCDVLFRFGKVRKRIILLPLAIIDIAILTNPLTHIMFSLDENANFKNEAGGYVAYFISFLYFINCVVMLFKYWKAVNYTKIAALAYFLVLTFIGMVVQLVFPLISCEILCEAIGLMGLMVMVEKEDERLDSTTKAYNRIALLQDLGNIIGMKRSFKIICIRVDNADNYRRIMGVDSFDRILSEIVSIIHGINTYLNVYRNGDANFFIIIPDADDKKVNDMAETLGGRFEEGFFTDKGETKVNATILVAGYPDEFKYADDIVLLSEAPLDADDYGKIIKGRNLEFLLRTIEVEKAISQGISENKFHVYYQPIYGKKCGCIKAAQALLKLEDDELGEVNFREFMPIAERTGFAEELEIRMIESIMQFLGNDVNKGYMNIDFVLIHIMAAKVLNKKLVTTVQELLVKYNVDPKLIAFDISDTMAEMSEDNLRYVVNEFYDTGIRLFLGNYGKDSSRITLDAMEKFDGVIMSAWRFLDPDMVKQGDIIMRARTDMLTQLGKKILIGGVDNKIYFEKILEVGGDYMSGNYMSAPLSKNEIQVRFWDYDRVVLGCET